MATAAPLQPAAPHRGVRALLACHQLVSFFVLAFAGTWLTELPYVLSEAGSGLLPFSSPLLPWTAPLATYMGLFLAAFVMTGATEGRGVGRFLRRFVLWRVGFRWYLFAFVGVPALFVLSMIVLPGGLGSFEGLGALASPLSLLGSFLYVLFLGGALGEEPGWRGFALPRLHARSSSGDPDPRSPLGLVAPASVLHALERPYHAQCRRVCPHDHPLGHHVHVGLQQHEGQRAYSYLAAHDL